MVKVNFADVVREAREKTDDSTLKTDEPKIVETIEENPKVSKEDFEGNPAFETLSEEEKEQTITEANQKQEEETSKGKPMEKDKLVKSGFRRITSLVSAKNKELEKQLKEAQKSGEIPEDVQKKLEELEQLKSSQSKYQSLIEAGVDPERAKKAMDLLNGMEAGGASFQKMAKDTLPQEVFNNLFIINEPSPEISLEDAIELSKSGYADPRENFDSEEEFLESAKKSIKTFRKLMPINETIDSNIITEQVTKNVLGEMSKLMEGFTDLKEKLNSLGSEKPPEVTPEEAPKEEPKNQLTPEQEEVQRFAEYALYFNKLSESDVPKLQELIEKEEAYTKAFDGEGLNIDKAKKGISLAVERYLKIKNQTVIPTVDEKSLASTIPQKKDYSTYTNKWGRIRAEISDKKDNRRPLV